MTPANLDFDLPEELIAQVPAEPRDAARLLDLTASGPERHRHMADLDQRLRPGDLMVLNRTRVLKARLHGHKRSGGAVEVLLVHPEDDQPGHWRCLVRGRVRAGTELEVAGVAAVVTACHEEGDRTLRFDCDDVLALTEARGSLPLPPYITREADESDDERYQTVFGDRPGSVAAPTASLHFTEALLKRIADLGVETAQVELRVGPGTFKPVSSERIEDHPMHAEWCEVPAATIEAIKACRARGGRVLAVGTTVVRSLESAWTDDGPAPFRGWTDCFLHPPKVLRCCDLLMTNFHLPRSTLLLLVGCLVGMDALKASYAEAIGKRYRFFSYGDGMLVPNQRLVGG
jgi:S-adenosylmethionine:tRNA ribosyltransferase-isomerase